MCARSQTYRLNYPVYLTVNKFTLVNVYIPNSDVLRNYKKRYYVSFLKFRNRKKSSQNPSLTFPSIYLGSDGDPCGPKPTPQTWVLYESPGRDPVFSTVVLTKGYVDWYRRVERSRVDLVEGTKTPIVYDNRPRRSRFISSLRVSPRGLVGVVVKDP